MKTCTKCKIEKPYTEFNKDTKRSDGLQFHCKSCNAAYRSANKEKIRAYLAEYREVNKEAVRAGKAAYASRNKDKIRRRNRDYRAMNKERLSEYQARYSKQNRQKIRINKAEYYERNKSKFIEYRILNAERIKAWRSLYYQKNKYAIREYREKMADRLRAYRAEFYAKNSERYAEYDRRRRARKLNAEGAHTAADISRIFESQRGLCASCNVKLFKSGKHKFHVDHIVPLARGGSDWSDNLQCLCPSCNLSKGAKDPIEWAAQLGRLF